MGDKNLSKKGLVDPRAKLKGGGKQLTQSEIDKIVQAAQRKTPPKKTKK
jgi:hypothetical protein